MSYAFEWVPGAFLLGTVLVLLVVPSFALIGLVVLALAAVAALVALAGAMLATPYLLVRSLHRPPLTPSPTESDDHSEHLDQPPELPRSPA